jgi:hypothetical protein
MDGLVPDTRCCLPDPCPTDKNSNTHICSSHPSGYRDEHSGEHTDQYTDLYPGNLDRDIPACSNKNFYAGSHFHALFHIDSHADTNPNFRTDTDAHRY